MTNKFLSIAERANVNLFHIDSETEDKLERSSNYQFDFIFIGKAT